MKIINKHGRVLSTFEEWEQGFIEVDKKSHWREGYSAYSLGLFFTSGKGEKWLSNLERAILGNELWHIEGEIEHASKLDEFRGGQRMQDLAIWAETASHESCFIGIEAKVLEPFGDTTVYDAYIAGIEEREKRNPRSKKAERVSHVTSFLFNGRNPKDEIVRDLRYQLMHYFKASALESTSLDESAKPLKNSRPKAKIVLLPILVFNTTHYKEDPDLADDNHRDYLDFVCALGCDKQTVNNVDIYHKKIDGRDLYTCYSIVDLL